MNAPTDVERAWAVLQPPQHAELSTFPIPPDLGGTSCRLAVDRQDLRHLLVPADTEQVAVDPRPSALSVSVRPLTFDGVGVKASWVDVCCTEPDLNPEFDDLINDVLQDVVDTDRPASAALRTIARWRRLFGSKAVRGLGVQAKRGLFAELMVLRTVLSSRPEAEIDVWTGPLREPHDFELSRHCIEVKAVGQNADSVTINGIRQLASHEGRALDLVVMTIIDDPAGMTLTDLVDEIKATTVSPQTFTKLLRDAGWTPAAGATDTDPFSVTDVIRVVVDDTLPRLIPGSLITGALPDELSELTYKLSLEAVQETGENLTLDDLIGNDE